MDIDNTWDTGLRRLKMRGRDLERLPPELFSLPGLEVLDLSPEREACLYYKLPYVPSDIGNLRSLKVLMLDTNELRYLPPEICQLENLERLSVSNNDLKSLPHNFNRLSRLKSLHMANNRFKIFPASLVQLRQLEFLDLCDNKIQALPDDISNLKNLNTLLLFINELTELPESICNMENLVTLWIGNNHIKRLPQNIGKLARLDWGVGHTSSAALDGNPLERPPLTVCREGVRVITEYYEQRQAQTDRSKTTVIQTAIFITD